MHAGLRDAGELPLRALYPGDATTRQGHSPSRMVNVLPVPVGIHKIKHVVIIMQENRSFDEYFGTYPGVEGFPPGGLRARPGKRWLHRALPRSRAKQ